MIRDKSFYRTFFSLALALALQNLLTHSVNMMDTLMLGRYSQQAMSGVSLCNQIQFLLQMLVVGAGEGAVVLGSQYWGGDRLEPIGHIIGAALRCGVVVAAVLMALVLAVPGGILRLLSSDGAVIAQGMAYFRVIGWTYILFAVTNVLVAGLRSVGAVRIGYVVSLSTLCINVSLNWLLIYGRMGFPEMGVQGAAVATLVSRTVELAIVIYYIRFREKRLRLTAGKLLRPERIYAADYMRTCWPMLLNQGLWGVAQMVQTGILGHLGGDVTAANALAVQLFQVLSVTAYGSASAAAILVGKAVGAGERESLRPLVRTLETLFLAIGVISASAIALAGRPLLAVMGGSLTANARTLAGQFIAVIALCTVGTSYQMACDSGIIRGGGDTGFSARMNLISMWLVLVPLAAAAAFWWRLPPVAVFFLLKWDQLYKIIPVAIRLHSWKWVRPLTREEGKTE